MGRWYRLEGELVWNQFDDEIYIRINTRSNWQANKVIGRINAILRGIRIPGLCHPLNQLVRHVINSPESYSCSNSPIPLPYLESCEPVFLLLFFPLFVLLVHRWCGRSGIAVTHTCGYTCIWKRIGTSGASLLNTRCAISSICKELFCRRYYRVLAWWHVYKNDYYMLQRARTAYHDAYPNKSMYQLFERWTENGREEKSMEQISNVTRIERKTVNSNVSLPKNLNNSISKLVARSSSLLIDTLYTG